MTILSRFAVRIFAALLLPCVFQLSFAQSVDRNVITTSSEAWRSSEEDSSGWQLGEMARGEVLGEFTEVAFFHSHEYTYLTADEELLAGEDGSYPRFSKHALCPSWEEHAVKRWTSSFEGRASVLIDAQLVTPSINGVSIVVFQNGEEISRRDLGGDEEPVCEMQVLELDLKRGDVLDFMVDGRLDHRSDWTHLHVTIAKDRPGLGDVSGYFAFDEEIDFPSQGFSSRDPRVSIPDHEKLVEAELASAGRPPGRRSRVLDCSGAGCHGHLIDVLGKPMWSPGIRGNALCLSRQNTRAHLPGEGLGKGKRGLTVSFWMAPNALHRHEGAGLITSAGEHFFGFSLPPARVAEGQPVELRFVQPGGRHRLLKATGHPTLAHQWTHVAAVWKAEERLELYLNGELVASDEKPPKNKLAIDGWCLGFDARMPEKAERKYCGLLDELLIFEKAVQPERIRNFYQRTKRLARPGLDEGCGYLRREDWYEGMNHADLASLHQDQKFHEGPSDVRCQGGSETGHYLSTHQAKRVRGYLKAPVSGYYTFWLASMGDAQFSLSPDESKFHKRPLVHLSHAFGIGTGVSPLNLRSPFDQYEEQQSQPVRLEAGQKYYLEILQTQAAIDQGNIRLAWRAPGGERQSIPAQHLFFYRPEKESNDADDDSLPDSWEAGHGLDVQDRGQLDPIKQGERGDFDGDGLVNHDEFLRGTDPSNPDTDGDGHSDGKEANTFGSDPLVKDSPQGRTIAEIDPSSAYQSEHSWHEIDDALISANHRGKITWNFTLDQATATYFELTLRLDAPAGFNSHVPLSLALDGQPLALEKLHFVGQTPRSWRVLGPRLAAGSHSLTLHIRNDRLRRSVHFLGLKIVAATGADTDGDGLPDWYAAELYRGTGIKAHPTTTAVSPFFIEGTVARAQEGDASSVLVDGTAARAFGQHQWFADIPLTEEVNTFTVTLPDGRQEERALTWTTTNILATDDPVMRIRPGDTLKLGGLNPAGQPVNARLRINGGDQIVIPAAQPYLHTFTEPGVYRLIGRNGGQRHRLQVEVPSSPLPEEIATVYKEIHEYKVPVLEDQTLDRLARTLSFEGSQHLIAEPMSDHPDGSSRLRLIPEQGGPLALATRLHEDGPILSVSRVPAIVLVNSLTQDATFTLSSGAPDGYVRLHAPISVLHLPQGAYLELNIFRTGVMFLDGSTQKRLYADDFAPDGLTFVDFLFPKYLAGGYCHRLGIYDANGEKLFGH